MSEVVALSNMLQIDRSTPFDPTAFIGEGWSIVAQDERSLALSEIDLEKVRVERMPCSCEVPVESVEHRRAKDVGHIHLDAIILLTLLRNRARIPSSWVRKGTVNFKGTVFRDPSGDPHFLYLCWDIIDSVWLWATFPDIWIAEGPSAFIDE